MSGVEQTRKSWRYPGDKLNRNLLGRTSGLSKAGVERFLAGPSYRSVTRGEASGKSRAKRISLL